MAAGNTSASNMLWCVKTFIFSTMLVKEKQKGQKKVWFSLSFHHVRFYIHKSKAGKRFRCLEKPEQAKVASLYYYSVDDFPLMAPVRLVLFCRYLCAVLP